MTYKTNANKDLKITVDGVSYLRIPIKTHVIMPGEDYKEVLDKYLSNVLIEDDIVFIAESIIATMQNRAVKLEDIEVRWLARFLSKLVYKNPGGIGLTNPEMMEMAFREAGTPRMLLATLASAVGKLLKKRGWFYLVAGDAVRDIDGPDEYTIAPYNQYVVLAPKNPNDVAKDLKKHLKHEVMIVDINDLGQNILGNSSETIENELIVKILKDNPLGQSDEQTPIGIIRKNERV